MCQFAAFAFGVPHDINGFHPYTMSSANLSHSRVMPFPPQFSGWAGGFDKRLTLPPTHPLRPIIPDNAWGTRITAAAGTSLATPYSCSTIKTFSYIKDLYIPKDFINHAASLRQTCVHCGRFSTAATRRCMVRVAVPSVEVTLSGLLSVITLVGHYPTN